MGKMMVAILLVISIEIAMSLFVLPPGVEGVDETEMFTFLKDPGEWSLNTWFHGFALTAATLLGVTGIIIGTFVTRHEWIWRAVTFGAVLLGMGIVVAQFVIYLDAALKYIAIDSGRTIIVTVLTSPLIIFFLFAWIDWVGGKD
jgi:hypothetical protein